MTTPGWLTVLVAAITGLLGLGGAIAGQWIATTRQVKLAEVEREVRRDEHTEQRREEKRQLREDCYATFLVAARNYRDTATHTTSHGADVAATAARLRDATAVIELRAPNIEEGALVKVTDAAERLKTVRQSGASAQVITEAAQQLDQAVLSIREAMRADVAAAEV